MVEVKVIPHLFCRKALTPMLKYSNQIHASLHPLQHQKNGYKEIIKMQCTKRRGGGRQQSEGYEQTLEGSWEGR